MKIVLSGGARAFLEQSGDVLAAKKPAKALAFIQQMRAVIAGLGEEPARFPLVERYKSSGIRRRPWEDIWIYYRVDNDRVEVVRIVRDEKVFSRPPIP